MKVAALTICSINYLSKALVLLDSYSKYHVEDDLYIVIVDKKQTSFKIDNNKIKLIWVEDLQIENFYEYAFCYDIIELNTNVKPTSLKYLLNKYDSVIYLDPDIYVVNTFDTVFEKLKKHSIIITPHSNTPILDFNKPDDADLLRFGAYNLGFIALSKCEESFNFLTWWSERCLKLGYYDPQVGLAVDQKWVDLAPAFYPNLFILHDIGYNVAFWNLHERAINKSNSKWYINQEVELKFFHFSSFDANNVNQIAYKQTRYPIHSRPDFTEIAKEYKGFLDAYQNLNNESQLYGFDYFDDGVYINPTLRRFYSILKDELGFQDNPFKSNSLIRNFSKQNGLLKIKKDKLKKLSFKDLGNYSFQNKLVHVCLKIVLRLIGPERYYSLMRYMGHISSIRNQKSMFIK
jgi:hypothetical protein